MHEHSWIIVGKDIDSGFPVVSCPTCGEVKCFNGNYWVDVQGLKESGVITYWK